MVGSMQAAVYRGPGLMEVREVLIPEVGPMDVLLKVRACGICGTCYWCQTGNLNNCPSAFKNSDGYGIPGYVIDGKIEKKMLDAIATAEASPMPECTRIYEGLFAGEVV